MSRNAEIIALREQKLAYQEIGDRYGISRERVRQILKEEGRADLCGYSKGPHAPQYETRTCRQCPKTFVCRATYYQVFCSRECRSRYITPRRRQAFDRMVILRGQGRSWRQVDIALGYTAFKRGSRSHAEFHEICIDAGIDPREADQGKRFDR